jgi:hypothetical protein
LIEGIASRAEVDLSAAACWLLVQYHRDPQLDLPSTAALSRVPLPRAQSALADLTNKGLLGADLTLTPDGEATLTKLAAERRATLSRLLDGWDPEQHADVAGFLTRLADEVGATSG